MAPRRATDTTTQHYCEQRPWGSFEELTAGDGYKVKLIRVAPGGKLSLQYHHHRSEHWVVVAGTALVSRDGERRRVGVNEHIHIALGSTHRVENTGAAEVVLVEVQCGSYLGEDDIVRLEDAYGRCDPAAADE